MGTVVGLSGRRSFLPVSAGGYSCGRPVRDALLPGLCFPLGREFFGRSPPGGTSAVGPSGTLCSRTLFSLGEGVFSPVSAGGYSCGRPVRDSLCSRTLFSLGEGVFWPVSAGAYSCGEPVRDSLRCPDFFLGGRRPPRSHPLLKGGIPL